MIAYDFLHPGTFRELAEDELSLSMGDESIADRLSDAALRLLLEGELSSPAQIDPEHLRSEPHLRIVDLGFLVAHRLLYETGSAAELARSALELAGAVPFDSTMRGLVEPAIEAGLAMSLLGGGSSRSQLADIRRRHGTDEDSNFVSLALLAATEADAPRGFDDPMTLTLAVFHGAMARDYKLPVALCLAHLSAAERGETLSSSILSGWKALTEVTSSIEVTDASSTKRRDRRLRHVYAPEEPMSGRGAWLLAGAHFLSTVVSAIEAQAKPDESWKAEAVIQCGGGPATKEQTASDIQRFASSASRWLRERCRMSECHLALEVEPART